MILERVAGLRDFMAAPGRPCFWWAARRPDDPAAVARRLYVTLPDGRGDLHLHYVLLSGDPLGTPGPLHTWDGNEGAPTVRQSLQGVLGDPPFHGWLNAGMLTRA